MKWTRNRYNYIRQVMIFTSLAFVLLIGQKENSQAAEPVTTNSDAVQTDASGTPITVGGGLKVDGYYADWEDYPKTEITYYSNNKQCNHYGQLAVDGDTLYGHFKMNELYGTNMQIQIWYIKLGGQEFAMQIQPEKNGSIDWSTQVSREVGTQTGLKVFIGYGNNNECDSEVAYTIYTTNHGAAGTEGDEIEFSLSLKRLAELTGVSEDAMGTITIRNPNIGGDGVTVAGSSTGAAVGVGIAALFAISYVGCCSRRRKKG